MKCVVCGERPATVPDRNEGGIGRQRLKVCSKCHADRLKRDLAGVLAAEQKRRGGSIGPNS